MLGDVSFGAIERPIRQRVDFDEVEGFVESGEWRCFPRFRLLPPDAGHPSRRAGKRPLKGQHLSHVAASLPFLNGIPEAKNTVASHNFFHLRGIGHHDADAGAQELFGSRERLIGLGKVPAGVERDGLDFRMRAHDGVEKNLILQTKAGRKNNAPRDGVLDCMDARAKIAGGAEHLLQRIRNTFPIVVRVRIPDYSMHNDV